MKNKISIQALLALMLVTAIYVTSCKKIDYRLETTDDVNIVGYLDKYPDTYSLWRKILDRTETSSFLNAYGNYTMFAPTNSGVERYLQSIGAPSVDAVPVDDLKDVVRFHLLEDTVSTALFTDGKLPVPTMYGQYLITGVSYKDGASLYEVNRQALVNRSNIRLGNGYIHEVDNVLVASKQGISAMLEAKNEFSIFVSALKETGYFDVLNKVETGSNRTWYTVLAETNSSLADSGINSYSDLKAKYSQLGDPANKKDSLNMYVAYHILPGLKYLADIILESSHLTELPQEVVSAKFEDQRVLINDDVFAGVYEKGVELLRPTSDNSAANGVWHTVEGHYAPKFRAPAPVYWDVSSFEEIRKLPAFYQKSSYGFVKSNEDDRPIKDIDWAYNWAATTLTYFYSTSSSISRNAVNFDVNDLPLGLPARAAWMEYTSPVVVKGRYKVWICYRARRQSSSSTNFNDILINGTLMQRQLVFTEFMPNGTDDEREAIGWKRYTANVDNNFASRLVGIIDIETTGKQTVRFHNTRGTQNTNHLDMIQFIPVDMPQVLPRLATDGSFVYQ